MTIQMFLEEAGPIPWDALEYVVGHVNYGGRVTDDNDRKSLIAILRRHLAADAIEPGHTFTASGIYRNPASATSSLEDVRAYVQQLPAAETPDVFGMHSNATVQQQLQEGRALVDAVAGVQPAVAASGSGKTTEAVVSDLCAELLASLPALLDKQGEARDGLFDRDASGKLDSLSVVLSQEIDRFNRLTQTMRSTLVDLQKSVQGLVVMSSDLELAFQALAANQARRRRMSTHAMAERCVYRRHRRTRMHVRRCRCRRPGSEWRTPA